MNLTESLSVRITPPSKKQRKVPGYWNWPELIAMAEKAIATGETQMGRIDVTYFAVVTPEYRVSDSVQTPEYLATHEKVSIVLYSMFFTLNAEKGEMVPCPLPI